MKKFWTLSLSLMLKWDEILEGVGWEYFSCGRNMNFYGYRTVIDCFHKDDCNNIFHPIYFSAV